MSPKTSAGPTFGGVHAVVIGSSMAGLLAARILSDHFARVTIIERDGLADTPESRKGVPQGRHLHGILNRGADQMERLFPGLFAELEAAGSVCTDMGATTHWYQLGAWKMRTNSGIKVHLQSRPFLEWKVRQRVLALPNVELRDETEVLHLLSSPDRSRVIGIQIRQRAADADEEALLADLVVDASGRGSRTPAWLEALGYGQVEESHVRMEVGYASRVYQRPAHLPDWKMLIIFPKPPAETRMGAMAVMEGDRWIVSLGGWHKDYPPTDEAGFLEFAHSLPVPDLYEVLKDAEPLTPIVTHKLPSNQRRHYERLARFPEGLAVLGDALCSFNPIYGQGMTTASLDAGELDACLREQARRSPGQIAGLADHFRKRVAKIIDVPWMLATSEDFRWPQTTGKRPPGAAVLHWYTNRLHMVCNYDSDVLVAFLHVMHMLKPPTALFAPKILWKVLTMRRPAHPAPAAAPPVPITSAIPDEVKRAA